MSRIIRKPALRPASGTTVAVLPPIPVTDGELLMRYARHGDDRAFAELVEKHGRLVWTVCWQVLRQHHEIEDAFQATFFILAKRARTIRSCDSLCGWLYRVAYRTALRSRMASKRKALVELMADELSTLDEKLKSIEQHEQRAVLMEELHLLPEKYQMPLVLCYLEGKSRRATAEELGITLETVKGRLSRGRQLLRHRLIRRGVSLSLAMAAMALPVKSAAAAVTPQLVGLTVAGRGKWLAGGAAAAVASTITTSTKVIHLAHQGTVAMTIASLAKPAVVAISLLGAMSATLAVDSADKNGGSSESQAIDLQANEEAIASVDETASDDGEGFVQIIAGDEVAADEARPMPPVPVAPIEAGTLTIEGHTLRVGHAPEMPRQPAPMRSPQPAIIHGPDVLIQSPVVHPDVHVEPFEFALHNDFKFENKLDLNLQVKVAELESQVVHLQLESKELEIAAFDEKGEKKEKLLSESRKKLLMAEAQQLKIQIEQQQMHLKAMEKALKEQVKEIGKQAKKAAEQAEWAVRDADFAAAKAMEIEKHAEAAVNAKAAQIAAHAAAEAAKIQAAQAEDQARFAHRKDRKRVEEFLLTVGDKVKIEVDGAFPDRPIHDVYTIEPMGTVALGASYGRVNIAGKSLIEAEESIVRHLKKTLTDVQVQVTYLKSVPLTGDKK
jgi:RNA polymerase sigma factor (sigma-70 family)